MRIGLALECLPDGRHVPDRGNVEAVERESAPPAFVCLGSRAAAGSRVPENVELFLPWNFTADRRAGLTSPEMSMPINNSP